LFFYLAQHIVKQIVDGLVYLHNHGIIHRDIKLSNLLLTETSEVVSWIYIHSVWNNYSESCYAFLFLGKILQWMVDFNYTER
jgi:serine/threonine protein kinase